MRIISTTAVLILSFGLARAAVAGPAVPAGPAVVLIIRHAEKPDDKADPNLAPRGFDRAKALATVLPAHFARPDFIFATKRSAHSNRPLETIHPLADALHMSVDTTFKDADVAALAHAVLADPKYAGKTVLIAWHHGTLPELAHALGATAAPAAWNPKTFDRVWQITYRDGAASFQDLPQRAMPGDSEQ